MGTEHAPSKGKPKLTTYQMQIGRPVIHYLSYQHFPHLLDKKTPKPNQNQTKTNKLYLCFTIGNVFTHHLCKINQFLHPKEIINSWKSIWETISHLGPKILLFILQALLQFWTFHFHHSHMFVRAQGKVTPNQWAHGRYRTGRAACFIPFHASCLWNTNEEIIAYDKMKHWWWRRWCKSTLAPTSHLKEAKNWLGMRR